MERLKCFFICLFFLNAFLIQSQENDCAQFMQYFEAGDYNKVINLIVECKKDNTLSEDKRKTYEYYLQISYGYLKDYANFDEEKLEKLTHDGRIKNNKLILDAYYVLSQFYVYSKNYEKAIELNEKLLFYAKQYVSIESREYVLYLSLSALTYRYAEDYLKAIEKLQQVLKIRKQLSGENSQDYSISLESIAFSYYQLGNFSKAVEFLEQTLNIKKQILGENYPDYSSKLNFLAMLYSKQNEYKKAIELGLEVLKIRKTIFGENHPDYAASLSNLAGYYSDLGDYSKAKELAEEALKIQKEVLGNDHPDCVMTLDNLANYYSGLGDYSKAKELGEEALNIRKKVLGENHPDYAISLTNFANYYSDLGDYSKAKELAEEALKIQKEVLGNDHPDYAVSLSNLANYCNNLGDYSKAKELGEEALNIRKKVLGENHPDYAISLTNLAGYYYDLGDYSKAKELGEKALNIQKKVIGENHPNYVSSLSILAHFYSSLGYYSKAIELGEEALSIRKKVLGKNHPDYALSLNNIASYYSSMGNLSKAIELEEEALIIQKKVFGENHPYYATSLNNLAYYYSSSGDYSKAIDLCREVLHIRKKIFGEDHPDYILSVSNLAFLFYNLNDYYQSAEYLTEAFHKEKIQLQSQFNWLTENERTLYWNKKNGLFFLLPSFSYSSGNISQFVNLTYDAALLSKALMLNSSIELNNLLMETSNAKVIEKVSQLRTLHFTLNKLYEKPISERYLSTDSLETVSQNLERELLAESKEYGDYTRFMSVTWQDVQKNLKERDVAIEFVEFPIIESDSVMYAALVLKKDWKQPKMIPLFEKSQLDQFLHQTPEKLYSGYMGKQLSRLMWKPLEDIIQKGDSIYFSAAGVYYQLALEYLPSDEGIPLCDLYNFRRLSSTRQLVLEKQNTTINSAALYGGIQYDVNPTEMASESKKYQLDENLYAYRGMSTDSLRGNAWVPLDNTIPEIEFISGELSGNHITTTVFTGIGANEESIKSLSGKKTNILHLATHGFFFPAEETRKINYFQMPASNNSAPDMSMRRSGLIMAGGNRAWSGDTIPEGVDDGILTAQEISILDFRKMDLVVLSACETGLGDISTSEGVFGLQRAFKKAGANTLVMSLWKVNDQVTKLLMSKFYQNLMEGKSKHDAFLEAQQFIRSRHPEPQNWAAFVMLD